MIIDNNLRFKLHDHSEYGPADDTDTSTYDDTCINVRVIESEWKRNNEGYSYCGWHRFHYKTHTLHVHIYRIVLAEIIITDYWWRPAVSRAGIFSWQ